MDHAVLSAEAQDFYLFDERRKSPIEAECTISPLGGKDSRLELKAPILQARYHRSI